MLGNKTLAKFLASTPDLGVAFLVINGPECVSVMKSGWANFARKHANLTIYIACCIHIKEVKDKVVPDHRKNGSYTNKVSTKKRADGSLLKLPPRGTGGCCVGPTLNFLIMQIRCGVGFTERFDATNPVTAKTETHIKAEL